MGFMLNRVDFVPMRYINKLMKRVHKLLIMQSIENIGVSEN
jgi:hypothetical protein